LIELNSASIIDRLIEQIRRDSGLLHLSSLAGCGVVRVGRPASAEARPLVDHSKRGRIVEVLRSRRQQAHLGRGTVA
jgi:hypothetical protein